MYNFLKPHVNSERKKLTAFNEFIMVLMRLRMYCSLEDLSYRFAVSTSTVSRVFENWITVMSNNLEILIVWPSREQLPRCFVEHYGYKVVAILDCFEIFVDRPSTLITKAMLWSNYKHHHTVKFLVCIAPQGVISYISRAWGGRVSDKHITQNSQFLANLLPGDVCLADRSFNIAETLASYGATLKIPAFTRGQSQLSANAVESTRRLANVRIHVERVIGLLRNKYQILKGPLSVEMLYTKSGDQEAFIDKIAKACCALTNLSDSVIPFE